MQPNSLTLKLVLAGVLSSFLISCSSNSDDGGKPAAAADAGGPIAKKTKNFDVVINSSDCMLEDMAFGPAQERLGRHIGFGDAACVKKVIEQGADVNQPVVEFGSGEKKLPLFKATESSSFFFANSKYKAPWAVLKVLIEAGADPKQVNKLGNTALQAAILEPSIKKDYIITAEYMVHSGKFDLNVKNKIGESAVHMAISSEQTDLIEMMLEKPADFELKNPQGETPLQMAINHKLSDIALKIVDKVFDVDSQLRDGSTALHRAIENSFEPLAMKIASKSKNLEIKNKRSETVLHKAFRAGMVDLSRQLLGGGANADATDDNADSPLHIALKTQNEALIQIIFNSAKEFDKKNNDGYTPLLLAAQVGGLEHVKVLLSKGASINSTTQDGRTALFLTDKTDVAGFLISQNINKDISDAAGESALTTAIRSKSDEFTSLLIEGGCSLTHLTTSKESVLDLAILGGKSAIAERLLKLNVNPNGEDSNGENAVFKVRSASDLALLAQHSAKIDSKNKTGLTPLHKFVTYYLLHVSKTRLDIIRSLLSMGANPNIKNYDLVLNTVSAKPATVEGVHAYTSGAFDATQLLALLVEFKVDLKQMDFNGNTALHLADAAEEIGMLLNSGVDPKIKNFKGVTALESRTAEKNKIEASLKLNNDLITGYKNNLLAEQAKPNPNQNIIALINADIKKVATENAKLETNLVSVNKLVAALK